MTVLAIKTVSAIKTVLADKTVSASMRIYAVLLLLLWALPAAGDDESPFLLRYAVLLGEQQPGGVQAQASGLASSSRLQEMLLDWDPSQDDAELRELLALDGLQEMARQAIELPARGGESRGIFYVKDQRLDIEIVMKPRTEPASAEFEVQIVLDGEMITAPRIISLLGQLATITTRDPHGSLLFLVMEADRLSASKAASAPPTEIERIDGIPLVDGERVKPPKVIRRPAHEYTEAAREARIQGVVILRLLIDEGGSVRDIEVLKTLPLGLEAAAIEAAREWRFEPPEVDGEPSQVLYRVAFQFAMDDEPESE